jgi:hypothetical protein
VAVLAGEDVAGQPQARVVDDQGLARQRGGAVGASLEQAVLCGGEVVAIEDAGAVALDPVGRGPAALLQDGPQARRTVADQLGGDRRLDAVEFVVDTG